MAFFVFCAIMILGGVGCVAWGFISTRHAIKQMGVRIDDMKWDAETIQKRLDSIEARMNRAAKTVDKLPKPEKKAAKRGE